MSNYTVEFEAMMANVTAPPLSLDEFRLYISHDPKARHALAFCEWYQRYRTVYFDRIPMPSTRRTGISSRAGLPRDFAQPGSKLSMRSSHFPPGGTPSQSISAPYFHIRDHDRPVPGNQYTLKSHSFGVLRGSAADSAFNTTSTGKSGFSTSSGGGASSSVDYQTGSRKGLPGRGSNVYDTTSYYAAATAGFQTHSRITPHKSTGLGRRRTLPIAESEFALEVQVEEQEVSREHIQSLLVLECWARFLSPSASELFDIPETELLYVKERLPLNITHFPHPLLCKSDMFSSLTSVTARDKLSACVFPSKPSTPLSVKKPESSAAAVNPVPHKSLQFQPYQQLKRGLVSQLRQASLSHVQPPLSLRFGVKERDAEADGYENSQDRAAEEPTSAAPKEFLAGLRRISTMPSLRLRNEIPSYVSGVAINPIAGTRTAAAPTKRLVSVGELQGYHHTLRPRPPFKTVSVRGSRATQIGYRPVPAPIAKLIVLNSVPPALFETIAKIAADYLLQTYFGDFYIEAHYNITTPRRHVGIIVSVSSLLAGCGLAAVLVASNVHVAWRVFALPLLWASAFYGIVAWKRVSIYSWWRCERPTSLASRQLVDAARDEERAMHTDAKSDIDLRAIREVTGTQVSTSSYVFIGTIQNIGRYVGESRDYILSRRCGLASKRSIPQNLGSISAISLWSHLTIHNAVIDEMFDTVIGWLLRGLATGDQWTVDFERSYYRVVEPYVLRGQCYIVCHQLAVLFVAWAVVTLALFLVA